MESILSLISIIVSLIGIYLTSFYNYLLFHSLAEFFSIVIAGGIFMIAWNARRLFRNHYLLFLGIAYFYVGGIDLLHTLAYKGMGVFAVQGSNLSTQLWIAARYLQAFSLLAAMIFLHRKLPPRLTFVAFGLATGLLLASIFDWGIFPVCYREGVGLTPFKIYSEYLICLLLLATAALLIRNHKDFDRSVVILLVSAILTTIVQELAFTSYLSVYGPMNLVGHLLKIVSFYLIYKAIVVTSLVSPWNLLFRDLTQSEEKFRSIFETNVVPIAYCRTDGSVIDANDNFLKLLGYTRGELDAGNVRCDMLTQSGSKTPGDTTLQGTGDELTEPPVEKEFVRRDGTKVPILFGASPVPGNPEQVITFAVDLTERKRAEQAMRESEERLRLFIRHAPVALAMFDREMRYLSFSRRWNVDYGLGDRNIRGLSHYEVFPEIPDRWREVHQRGLAGEIIREENDRFVRADGSVQWQRWEVRPWHTVSGEVSGIIIFTEDITDRKNAEEALRNLTDELKRSNADLQQFARFASHDLQAPLKTAEGFTKLLVSRYKGKIDKKADELLTYILMSVRDMQTIVRDLLEFSRIETAGTKLIAVDISMSLAHVIANLKSEIDAADARVTFDEKMPVVSGDPSQMVRLFQNLIGNALKFRGESAPVIDISADRNDGKWVFAVRDNGIGIDARYREQIFDIFKRLHGKSDFPGTGMGLAISKRIVERMGGKIWVESAPGKGSTFFFTVPLEKADQAPSPMLK